METDKKTYINARAQISQSKGNVDAIWRQTNDELTSIRLKNETHERERRLQEEQKRLER
jgi:hypothetical protein